MGEGAGNDRGIVDAGIEHGKGVTREGSRCLLVILLAEDRHHRLSDLTLRGMRTSAQAGRTTPIFGVGAAQMRNNSRL